MRDLLAQLFGQEGGLSTAQECARAVLILVYGLLLVRAAGRRVFGKWSALDIVVSVVVGSNLSRALTGSAPLWGTLAATTLLLLLHWCLARLAAHLPSASRLLEGEPVILGQHGRMDRRLQRRFSVSKADLNEAMRQGGLAEIEAAEQITLEPSGRITVLKKNQQGRLDGSG